MRWGLRLDFEGREWDRRCELEAGPREAARGSGFSPRIIVNEQEKRYLQKRRNNIVCGACVRRIDETKLRKNNGADLNMILTRCLDRRGGGSRSVKPGRAERKTVPPADPGAGPAVAFAGFCASRYGAVATIETKRGSQRPDGAHLCRKQSTSALHRRGGKEEEGAGATGVKTRKRKGLNT